MDTRQLSPEERTALTALVKSPGWYLVMSQFLIPNLQAATKLLDTPGTPHERQDMMRGVKHLARGLIEMLYRVADLPNPLDQHALALMADLRHCAGTGDASESQPPPQPSAPQPSAPQPSAPQPARTPPEQEYRRRVSSPV